MIWKLLWWKKPPRKNFVADFWRSEAEFYRTRSRVLAAQLSNLEGLIEERDAKIKSLREEVFSGKISVNEARAQIEAMNTGGHA